MAFSLDISCARIVILYLSLDCYGHCTLVIFQYCFILVNFSLSLERSWVWKITVILLSYDITHFTICILYPLRTYSNFTDHIWFILYFIGECACVGIGRSRYNNHWDFTIIQWYSLYNMYFVPTYSIQLFYCTYMVYLIFYLECACAGIGRSSYNMRLFQSTCIHCYFGTVNKNIVYYALLLPLPVLFNYQDGLFKPTPLLVRIVFYLVINLS